MSAIFESELKGTGRQESLRKNQICSHIAAVIKVRRLTQVAAAQLLGIDQAVVSRITRGQFHGVSETKLLALLAKLGCEVNILVGPLQEHEANVQIFCFPASSFMGVREQAVQHVVKPNLPAGTTTTEQATKIMGRDSHLTGVGMVDTSPAALNATADYLSSGAQRSQDHHRLLEAARTLRAVADEKEKQGWQPIETAPISGRDKKSTWFLASNGYHVGVCARRGDEGYGEHIVDENDEIVSPKPNHWKPLPEGPKT